MMVGTSAALRELVRMIDKAAPANSTVLIQGESGTGKELVARMIFQKSRRSNRPFICVNCAGVPDALLESELFGHEKGAFTGADRQRQGRFELAAGGTLFLDEVGEFTLAAQSKLLRVLQEREIDRIGGGKPIPIDIRLIAATNRNLGRLVAQGKFRQDLFYRLNVVLIRTPALRERADDIPDLALHFVLKYAEETGRSVRSVSPEALSALRQYPWPGNVRELENAIHRAVVAGEGDTVLLQDLPPDLFGGRVELGRNIGGSYRQVMEDTSRQLCIEAFALAAGDYRKAAGILGLHHKSIHRLIRRHGLDELLCVRE